MTTTRTCSRRIRLEKVRGGEPRFNRSVVFIRRLHIEIEMKTPGRHFAFNES